MTEYHYHLVDVFTEQPFGGNPLAVFPPQPNLPDGRTMARLAAELNLSETTFVLPSDDDMSDYRLRIFTPQVELPMAGHPTVGAAFVLAKLGLVDFPGGVIFQEGVGSIPVVLAGETVAQLTATMTQPLPEFGRVYEDRVLIAELLSLTSDDLLDDYPVQVISTGVPFPIVPLRSLDALRRAALRHDIWLSHFQQQLVALLLFTPQTEQAGVTVRSRMFAPGMGIIEDPATGAASGPLGAYLVHYGLAKTGQIISRQGVEMGRPSLISIQIDTAVDSEAITGVHVGGRSVYMGHGVFSLG